MPAGSADRPRLGAPPRPEGRRPGCGQPPQGPTAHGAGRHPRQRPHGRVRACRSAHAPWLLPGTKMAAARSVRVGCLGAPFRAEQVMMAAGSGRRLGPAAGEAPPHPALPYLAAFLAPGQPPWGSPRRWGSVWR